MRASVESTFVPHPALPERPTALPSLPEYRDPRLLARITQLTLAVAALVHGWFLVDAIQALDELGAMRERVRDLGLPDKVVLGPTTLAISEALTTILVAVAFLAFLAIAYDNARALRGHRLRFSRAWAIGCWFIPILWLWRPKQITNDVWRGDGPDRTLLVRQRTPGMWLLNAWWAAWVAAIVFFGPATELRDGTVSFGRAYAGYGFEVTAQALFVVAAVLLIGVVGEIAERQVRRAKELRRP